MLFLALLAVAAPAAFADPSATVSIPQGTGVPGCEQTGECFMPADASVDAGGSVTWTNDDSVYHTIRAGDLKYPKITGFDYPNGFRSELLAPGDTFEAANLQAGDYPYFCSLHPWATGMLSVTVANDGTAREPGDKRGGFDQTRYDELAREVEDLRDQVQALRDVVAGQAKLIQQMLEALYPEELMMDDNQPGLELTKLPEHLPDEDVTVDLSVSPLKPSYTLGDVIAITAEIPPVPSEHMRYGLGGSRLDMDERVSLQMYLESRSVLGSTCYIERHVNCSSGGDYTASLIGKSASVGADGSILFEGKIAITPDFQAGTYKILVSHDIKNANLGVAESGSIMVRNPTQGDPRPVSPSPPVTPAKVNEIIMPQGTGVPGCEQTGECFIPSEVSVAAGSSVTWVNDDSVLHTVWAGDIRNDAKMVGHDYPNGFQSRLINPGDAYTAEDLKAGTYPFYCSVHPWMTGTLQVR